MSITLIKAKTLKARLTNLVDDSINNTMSLAYYSMVNGNVNPLANAQKNITTSLHPKYRQFVCAQFKDGKWMYNKSKATKMLASLELDFNQSTFEQFVEAVDSSVLAKQAEADDKKAQEEALSPAQIKENHLKRLESYLKAQLKNVSTLDIRTVLARIDNSKGETMEAGDTPFTA